MKKTQLILLIVVLASMAMIITKFGDFSTYETFGSAAKEPGKQYMVIGFLDKTQAMNYDPIQDPNHFTFYAKDKAGEQHKVLFMGAKPDRFERSERLVMTGYMQGNEFYCKKIKMKCPSKYKKDQVEIGS